MANLWEDCIEEAFEVAEIKATPEQIKTVAGWVEGLHENYGMVTGNDVASDNFISDAERELERLKQEREKHDAWVNETEPCRACVTTGIVLDGWGRDQRCDACSGDGRIKKRRIYG